VASAEKVLAKISTEDKVFSSLDKQLPQSSIAPKVTPISQTSAVTLTKSPTKAQATASAQSPAKSSVAKTSAQSPAKASATKTPKKNKKVQRTLNSQLVPRVPGCQTPVDNFYTHAAAFRRARQQVHNDNAALDRIDANIRGIDAQISAIQNPQWEPQPEDVGK
jgi:hypothetical protein